MSDDSAPKYWEKTRLNNLVRHTNGRYYARLYRNGKEKWQSLKTKHFSVAEAKLAELQKEHREHPLAGFNPGNAKMTFGDASRMDEHRLDADTSLKRRTRKYWKEIRASVAKSWPDLEKSELRRVTPIQCKEWAARYAADFSATRYNAAISLLRRVMEIGIENGIIYSNPAAGLKRKAPPAKKLELPTLAIFSAFIAEMRRGRSRDSNNCADLAEGLAYTGIRIGEAGEVSRGDVNLVSGELRVSGDPVEGTKNGEIRQVPLIPQARLLFARMLAGNPAGDKSEKIFKVRECQKAMDRAAKKIGMTRVTHHDLRHFFATVCIESGVDLPTVSRWLGHKDGGALAMRTYGHLRREHSVAQAQKVSFIPAT
ncbi:MAG TPA: tyrosine-type recombinase/integrase [Chthoniobacter sp.]|nr:tyrosine-type recombinase/integrase [Chthoniobacter sp.]